MLKTTHLLLLSLLILSACKEGEPAQEPEQEEPETCVLDGSFSLVNDSVRASLLNSDSLLIEELSFFKDHCTFTYDSIGYRGTYGCMEPYVWVAVEGFDTLRLEKLSDDEYYGQGFIEGRYLRKGSKVYEETLAALTPDAQVEKNKPQPTVTPEKPNTPTEEKKKTDKPVTSTTPPATNGSLKPAKVSFGDNLSGNTYRVRLYEPYTGSVKSSNDAKIYLMLTVDAQGSVLKAENNAAKTANASEELLNEIIALAKKIKYNKESGAKLAKVPLTVTVNVD